ncbi:MAG: ferritin-like domain-containing protein [Acidobacteriaceae bacterium]|nr:ferritin-like domain-containing protein [Acidobacteriaceae bacterium]
MAQKSIIPDVIAAAQNRRSFVRKLGIATAAVGAGVSLGLKEAQGATTTDVNVLNFALNLEYLEAEFYTWATTGNGIEAMGIGVDGNANSGNPTTGGSTEGASQVTFSNSVVFTSDIANEIAADERDHVVLLRTALGSAKIAKPNLNLGALGFGFGSQDDFLKLARIFEDIGVTAYAGAAPLLSSAIVATAARILAAEAEHASNIRLQVARLNIATAPPLDGVDILPPPSNPNQYFSLNDQGLCNTRTPGQVLYLAFGNKAGVNRGGFFPTGVNGYFTESSSPA